MNRAKYIVLDTKGKIVSTSHDKYHADLTPLESGDWMYKVIRK